ncbi:hypothetical protein JWH08_00145, partial [Xanthomonas campestris pv. campestris]|uniref:hypothetical protein n=1 Tax=Xanthomonas campestris TaxID=339 RepID=UPI001E2E75B6
DKPDDLLGAESALLHVRPLGFTDFIASAGTAQWGQVTFSKKNFQVGGRVLLVAPEKPPITQRPQGLDVCSGVPELPVFATLKAGFW